LLAFRQGAREHKPAAWIYIASPAHQPLDHAHWKLYPASHPVTAARAMTRAGIPMKTAMELLGHKTVSIFFRYNIIDEGDLIDGGEKLAAYFAARSQRSEQKVVPLRTGTE